MRGRRRPEPRPRVGRRLRAAAQVLATVLTVAGLVTACARDEAPSAPRGQATAELRLGLVEWDIETGGVQLLPGEVQVRVTNAGGARHDVVIHGEQGTWESPVLEPGASHEMVITTVAGEELSLVCSLTGHHSQGMHARIDVVEEG